MSLPFDHRLVQTGVIGHKDSDEPIILPMEAHELERWRRQHPTYTYWCGVQLGGCGRQLADRLYRDKVCHFAHHPNPDGSPVVCNRTANGEDSADHLFIKQGVARWLKQHQLPGRAVLRNLGTGPGDAVDVHLPKTRQRFRFQLSNLGYPAWRRADDELADDADGVDWIFGRNGPITQEMLGRFGYTLRVRCETDGAARRVYIGTERPNHTIDWAPFEDCTLSPSGLVTPTAAELKLVSRTRQFARPRPKPAAFVLQSSAVFAVDPKSPVPTESPLATDGRYLVAADVKPADSRIVRALISFPADVPTPAAEHVYRFTGTTRLLLTEPDGTNAPQWLIEARTFARLTAHEPTAQACARRHRLRPSHRPNRSLRPHPPAVQSRRAAHREARLIRAACLRRRLVSARCRSRNKGARPRSALHRRWPRGHQSRSSPRWYPKCGRRWRSRRNADRTPPGSTWSRRGLSLLLLSIAERTDLLVEVDRETDRHRPPLSSSVRTASGGPLPYLASILTALGRPLPVPALAPHEVRRIEVQHTKPRPPGRGDTTGVTPRAKGLPCGVSEPNVEQVQQLITTAQGLLLEVTGDKPRRLAEKAVLQARSWLRSVQSQSSAARPQLDPTQVARAKRAANRLSRAIAAAQTDIAQTKRARERAQKRAPSRPTTPQHPAPASPTTHGPTTSPLVPAQSPARGSNEAPPVPFDDGCLRAGWTGSAMFCATS